MLNKKLFLNFSKYLIIILIAVLLFIGFVFGLSQSGIAFADVDVVSFRNKLMEQQQVLDNASKEHYQAVQAQNEAKKNIEDLQGQIEQANDVIEENNKKIQERARYMYRSKSSGLIDVLIGADSISQLIDTFDKLNFLNKNNAKLIEQSNKYKSKIENLDDKLNTNLEVANEQEQKAAQIEADAKVKHEELQAELWLLSPEDRAKVLGLYDEGYAGNLGKDAPAYDPATHNAIVDRALAEIGKPYIWGAVGPAGYDCSGLVSYCISGQHKRIGVAETFMNGPRVSDPQPGDICANSGHCGIFYGAGKMIHAPTTGDVVKIGPVQSGMVFTRW